ncbi:HlyD family secretion protein [Caulifigura coniformis]|uniref:HlyD family secretion protein n=1 Tax=Caulifigura coniformis TaxID=2527983 RepID=A0A517SCW8_9PLAN|nr:HlyD family efflux transporter periplasmic adaptor subunit [Caulifigura coniformis]QDT53968.1 HlyD family secretion protein [Caulifigura coniformis]
MGTLLMEILRSSGPRSGLALAALLGSFTAAASFGVDAGEKESPSPGSSTFFVPQARTTFVLRRNLSADRVGVLGMTPEEGEYVTANSIVAKLKDEVPQAAVAASAAKAESDAEITAADKLAESERLEATLMDEANRNAGVSRPPYPKSDVDRARLRAEAADLQTGVKRHEKRLAGFELAQAQAELKTFHIITPIDGIVTRVFKRAGEGVQQAESILEVVNTTIIRVEGRIPAAVASRVKVGSPVRVRFKLGPVPQSGPPGPAIELEAKLGFVDVSAEGVGEERYVRVWTELVNPRQMLRDGTPAEMTIVLDTAPGEVADASVEAVPEASSRAGSKPSN